LPRLFPFDCFFSCRATASSRSSLARESISPRVMPLAFGIIAASTPRLIECQKAFEINCHHQFSDQMSRPQNAVIELQSLTSCPSSRSKCHIRERIVLVLLIVLILNAGPRAGVFFSIPRNGSGTIDPAGFQLWTECPDPALLLPPLRMWEGLYAPTIYAPKITVYSCAALPLIQAEGSPANNAN
jgi:hypothetical protein